MAAHTKKGEPGPANDLPALIERIENTLDSGGVTGVLEMDLTSLLEQVRIVQTKFRTAQSESQKARTAFGIETKFRLGVMAAARREPSNDNPYGHENIERRRMWHKGWQVGIGLMGGHKKVFGKEAKVGCQLCGGLGYILSTRHRRVRSSQPCVDCKGSGKRTDRAQEEKGGPP